MADLQTTQTFSPEALNNHRLSSMLNTLQEQRESQSNEVVNAKAEIALLELKLASEIQVSRSGQAALAQQRASTVEFTNELEKLHLDLAQLRFQLSEVISTRDQALAETRLLKSQRPDAEAWTLMMNRQQFAFFHPSAELLADIPDTQLTIKIYAAPLPTPPAEDTTNSPVIPAQTPAAVDDANETVT